MQTLALGHGDHPPEFGSPGILQHHRRARSSFIVSPIDPRDLGEHSDLRHTLLRYPVDGLGITNFCIELIACQYCRSLRNFNHTETGQYGGKIVNAREDLRTLQFMVNVNFVFHQYMACLMRATRSQRLSMRLLVIPTIFSPETMNFAEGPPQMVPRRSSLQGYGRVKPYPCLKW